MTPLLRRIFAVLLLCLATLPARAGAGAGEDTYETLLSALATAESQAEADRLSSEIWQIWLTAPDETAQEVLDNAMRRRQAYDFLGAIDHLNRLIQAYPDYAEGWNQRATMYFMRGDLEASLADVAEVLAREPRHFGALSGKAVILFQQGKVSLAQIAVREALKYHPFLSERAMLDASPGTDL
jgi:tetratricopeptide (TPR) repeat protein